MLKAKRKRTYYAKYLSNICSFQIKILGCIYKYPHRRKTYDLCEFLVHTYVFIAHKALPQITQQLSQFF